MARGIHALVVLTLSLSIVPAIAQPTPANLRPSCVTPPASTAAWWSFNERSGTAIEDLRGTNAGEANGAVNGKGPSEVRTPAVEGALSFDGIDDAITIRSNPSIDFGRGDFSIQLWLRADLTPGVTTILDKRQLAYRGYSVFLYNGNPGLQMADGDYSNYIAPVSIANGRWHHIVISVSRTENAAIRWYIDGETVAEQLGPRRGSLANDAPLRIAAHAFDGTFFRGALDEIALFDRALTADEASALATASSQGLCKPSVLPPTAAHCGGAALLARTTSYDYEGQRITLTSATRERYLLVQAPGDPSGITVRSILQRSGLTAFTLESAGSALYPETRDLFLAGFDLPSNAVTQLIARVLQAPGPIVHVTRVYPDSIGGWVAPLASVFAEFRQGLPVAERAQLVAAAGLRIREIEDDDVIELAPTVPLTDTFCQANLLLASGKVVFAEPNFWLRLPPMVDPLFVKQWGLQNNGQAVCNAVGTPGADASVPAAWATSTGAGIRIAIIDDGVQRSHPDLDVIDGKDFWNGGDGSPVTVYDRHGTACAGIAAARGNNGLGGQGVAFGAQIVAVKFANSTLDGKLQTANKAKRKAIRWAWKDAGAHVLSNSWGSSFPSGAVKRALRRAKRNGRGGKGAVILFASGNDVGGNGKPLTSQAELDEVIAVGASSPCDQRKSLSSCDGENWGSNYGPKLDVVAPGVKMVTTDRTGSDGYVAGDSTECFSGTSAATPFAAGVAALVLAVNNSRTSDDVALILERGADDIEAPGFDNATGAGRVNAARSVSLANCALSGNERAATTLLSGARSRVYRFVPGEIFVSAGRTLLKIKGSGGTGQNMFALNISSAIFSLSGYNYLLGTQHFPATIRDVEYVNGTTLVGLDDGRVVKIAGTGGTGQNMFAINVHPSGFTGVSGYPYYLGSHRFNAAIRDIVPLGGETLFTFDDGKALKVNGSCGTGVNFCAITETSSGFNPVPGYAYYSGEFRFQAPISVVEKVGTELWLGFENRKMLKIAGNGGTGHNMFAISETSSGFNSLPGYPHYVGDHRFNAVPTTITVAGGETLIGFANGKMLKIAGNGGTGHNMFAITESAADISGLNGYHYYVGDQRFSAAPLTVLYRGNETLVGLADGRLLKVKNTGGTGHNMFAVHAVSNGFDTEPGYTYLTGSANFNVSVTSLAFVDGQTFVGMADGGLLKVSGTAGTGYNLFAVARNGVCFEGLCGFAYYLGCQNLSHPIF